MSNTTPTATTTDAELEQWFDGAGLRVTVVPRCPDPMCGICCARLPEAA